MTTNTNGRGEIVEGLVASGNDRRIKLAGQDHYFNYSRFHDVPHPDRGQLVRVEVDPSGFINRLQVLDDAEASAPSSAAAPAPVSDVTRVGRPLVPDRTARAPGRAPGRRRFLRPLRHGAGGRQERARAASRRALAALGRTVRPGGLRWSERSQSTQPDADAVRQCPRSASSSERAARREHCHS